MKKFLKKSEIPLIVILHTFGRDLKFHPHLHLIAGANISFQEIKNRQLSKYIARYVRHPAIANGRIAGYNKKEITFYYSDNEDKEVYITKSMNNFISSLIQHIPPKQFKMIRHYGLYSRNKKILKVVR